MQSKTKADVLEAIFYIAFFIAATAVYHLTQGRISVGGGQGWDGSYYYAMVEQINHSQPISGWAPFVYRFGTSALVSFIGCQNILNGFLIVNLVFSAIATLFLFLFLKNHIDSRLTRALLVILFMTHWSSPVRFIHFYPAYTDPSFFAFVTIGLFVMGRAIKTRPSIYTSIFMMVMCFFAVMFRESCIALPIAYLFISNPLHDVAKQKPLQIFISVLKIPFHHWLPIIGAISGTIFVHKVVPQSHDFIDMAINSAYSVSFAAIVLAIFYTGGLLLSLAVFNYKSIFSFLARQQAFAVLLLLLFLMGLAGGTDTQRLFYWMAPLLYLLIGISITQLKNIIGMPLLATLIVAQLITNRLFFVTPDPNLVFESPVKPLPLFTPWGSNIPYLDLYPQVGMGNDHNDALILGSYLFATAIIFVWLHYNTVVSSKKSA